jgi:branched-chain amino acid transport system substrate-binding protein
VISVRWPKPAVIIALVALALPLIACGSGGKGASTPGPSATPSTPSATTPAPTSSGPSPGVSNTEIKIGTLLPLSQSPAAAWGVPISKGMKAYFDYINAQGGIYGRKINFIIGDNQYTGPVSSEVARRMVEQDRVFAIQGSLGSEAENAIYAYLQSNGVPDMFILTGDSKWTNPVSRNRFVYLVEYLTEGRILGKYIGDNYNGKKLGILEQADAFGQEGEAGLRQGLQDAGASMDVTVETYSELETDMTSQTERLKGANVDVVAVYGQPLQAASLIRTARETLGWDVPVVLAGVDVVQILGSLAGVNNIEGTVSVSFGLQSFQTDQAGIAKYQQILSQYASGVAFDNLSLVGMAVSEAMVHVLRRAGPDLTRDSFLNAAQSVCTYDCPSCIAPNSTSATDHDWNQAEIFVKATMDNSTSPPTFEWQPFGNVISYESTTSCATPTPPPGYANQPE